MIVTSVFLKTLYSLRNITLWKIIILCVLTTALLLALFIGGATWLLGATAVFSIVWLDWLFDIISGTGASILAWFLFPAMLPLIATLFIESTAKAVENQEYPHTIQPANHPFWSELANDALFALKALFLNILCLPLYLIPLINIAVYYSLNAYLLGNEFFILIAGRHHGKKQANALRKQHRFPILLAGLSIAIFSTLPAINWLAPILGIILMVHLYHKLPSYIES